MAKVPPPKGTSDLIWLVGKEPPPKLKVIALSDIVAFPFSICNIDIPYQVLAKSIMQDGFAVIIHTFREEGLLSRVGTLGMISQTLKHKDREEYRISFACLSRVEILNSVKLETPEGPVFEVEWKPVPPSVISQEAWQKKSVRLNLQLLTIALAKLHDIFAESYGQKEDEFQADDETKAAAQKLERNLDELEAFVAALKAATPQDIEQTLDRAMDTIEQIFLAAEEHIPPLLLELLRSILWTLPFEERLHLASEGLTSAYLHLDDILYDEDEEKTDGEDSQSLITALLSQPREIPPALERIRKNPPEGEWIKLDLSKRGPLIQMGMDFAGRRMVNQEQALEQCFRLLTLIKSGLANPEMAKILGMFCGPTGVGKTEIFKVLAEFLFGDRDGFTFIKGNTLTEPHSTARLTGSPPGYVGYGEENEISQWGLDRPHVLKILRDRYRGEPDELKKILEEVQILESQLNQTRGVVARGGTPPEDVKRQLMALTGWRPGEHLSLLCLDEIEKAHINVQYFLLDVLNEGKIQKANGEIVIVKNMLFGCTSNVYGREIAQKITGRKVMGIRPRMEETLEEYKRLADEIYHETLDTLEKGFIIIPELLGRIGKEKVRVFYPFSAADIREILEAMRLPEVAVILKERGIELYVTEAAIAFLQKEVFDTTNRSLGARAVHSVVQRKVTENIANQIDIGANGGIVPGDSIVVDVEDKEDGNGQRIIIKKLVKRSSQ